MLPRISLQCFRRTLLFDVRRRQIQGPDQILPALTSCSQQQHAFYSQETPKKRPSLFGNILSNIQEEFAKNKEMQADLKKFREEAKKLEESEALKEAKRKFEAIEAEAAQSGSAIKDQIADKSKELLDSEPIKKAGQAVKKVGEISAQSVGKVGEILSDSELAQKASTAAVAGKEFIEGDRRGGKVYQPPLVLRKRKQPLSKEQEKIFEANEEATGVELHKDSKLYEQWKTFTESNEAYKKLSNKFIGYRIQFDESDNLLVRGSRSVFDRIKDSLDSALLSGTSQVVTEIIKIDPNFTREQFLKDCERDIIPNILEAYVRCDLDILEDWCFEAPFHVLATPIRENKKAGLVSHGRILEIEGIDLVLGQMKDSLPFLVIQFNTQMVECVKDRQGKVMHGNPDKVLDVTWIWSLCRDVTELDSRAAWRLAEVAIIDQKEKFF